MDKLEYELVTLRNGNQYFVLEDLLYKYDTYDLVLNVEDEDDMKIVLQEVKNGKKETHWIWFIFPQLYGLGHSEMSQFYGLNGREEAEEYIKNDTLRKRLVEICEAVLNNEKSVYEIFGNDAVKVRSCVLLFESISDIPVLKKLKSKYRW